MLSISLCKDVLAIRNIDIHIIIGIGNQLHIFDKTTLKLVKIVNTSHQDTIHEIIKASNDKLIVFGGKNLSIFRFHVTNQDIIIQQESFHQFNDWIIAADFFTINCDNLYILFAHNNLYLYNTSNENYTNLCCEVRCILYSGAISRENISEAIIFSGTVFQEILIWKVNNTNVNLLDSPILYRLLGHKGVIFSIYYDRSSQLITSTSDDRTVRLWKIKNNATETVHTDWNNVEINLTTTIFGHTARVWKSIIVDDNIISIGEDSLICIWTLDGQLCNKILAHDGATVWCIDVSVDKKTLYTGGADGAVNSWPIHNQTTNLLPILQFETTKTPKYISYLKSGMLIVFLDDGELLIYDHLTKEPKNSMKLSQYQSYCLMQVCPERIKIALASKDGIIEIFRAKGSTLELFKAERVMDSKIFALHWLDEWTLLVCGDKGQLKVLEIIENEMKFRVQIEFTLPPSRERWTTAAIIIGNLLLCGDRAGSVYVFSMDPNVGKNPKQYYQKIHGRLGVQSFGIYGEKIISTGRDGSLRFYRKLNDNSSVSLQALHWKKMPMEWVSRVLKTDKDLFVLGFKEIEFMIYSLRLNRLILRIICGGGHRSWDCTITNDILNFACIRNKQIYALENQCTTFSDTLIAGYHTKEIHSLEQLPTATEHKIFITGSEDCCLRIGNIVKSSFDKYNLQSLDTYDGHISCVKSIAVINLQFTKEQTENLVFSGGGRAQLKVWKVCVNTVNKILTSNDVIVSELTSFMLRGTDKDRRKTWLDKKQPYFVDPETRFMDITTYLHSENFIIVIIACSDGFLRILSYNIACNDLNLITTISYYNRCIIKVHSFVHDDQLILLSMATDGFINFWSINSIVEEIVSLKNQTEEVMTNLQPFAKWKTHQSGVNSCDFRKIDENKYYIATGGDDNKLNLSMFTICKRENGELSINLINTWNSTSIHSAQITGIKFIGDNELLSVAIDQRIVMHHYLYDNSSLLVTPVNALMTFVTDAQGLTLLNNTKDSNQTLACIHGQGLEVILIENHDNEKIIIINK